MADRLSAALADRYRIERELGAGGMATVYLAHDVRHNREVAVKVLRPELAAALGHERFLREIEIAAGLSHPHIDGASPQTFLDGAGDVHFIDPDLVVFSRQGRTGADLVAQRYDPEQLRVVGPTVTIAEGARTAGTVPSYAVTPTALTYLPTARVDEGPLLVDTRGVILDSVVHQGTWTVRYARQRPAVALVGLGIWVHDLARGTTLPVKSSGIYSFAVWGPGDSTLTVMDLLSAQGGTCTVRLLGLGSGSREPTER